MDALNSILNALHINKETNYNITNHYSEESEYIEYYNYIIKNNVFIKTKIEEFNKIIMIPSDIFLKCNGCNLSLVESMNTLNYLISRKEIHDSMEKSDSSNSNNFKEIISSLFSRIIVIYLEKCNESDDILNKYTHNAKMCEIAIHYRNIFTNNIFKDSFDKFYKSLTYRCFYITTNYGCVISWLTFAKLAPEMVNEDCYPKINQDTVIFKNINKNYLKENKMFIKELELLHKFIL
jgi:hypothetical protein